MRRRRRCSDPPAASDGLPEERAHRLLGPERVARGGVGAGERREELDDVVGRHGVEPQPLLAGDIVDNLAEVLGDPFPWTQSHGFIHGLVPPVHLPSHLSWRIAGGTR